ncbi:MAG TPA: hypothetical protein VK486_06050 [Thermoleophilaceae bacterium]|nr:hypothetical protein [Thermoleophilaceae bacterium]
MNDFFGALEVELRQAGRRAPRRMTRPGDVAGVVVGAALLVAAVVVAIAVMGGGEASRTAPAALKPDPVGTVIPKGEGTPPREARSVVVATGTAPGVGPWQMEVSRSSALRDPETRELYQPAGLRCLWLLPVDPGGGSLSSGGCGEFSRTPGFGRGQVPGIQMRGDSEQARRLRRQPVLVYGRVPESAARVVVTAPDGLRLEARPHEGPPGARGDFYAVSVRPGHPHARINWLDEHGEPGSRGIELMPPITRR